MTPRASKMHISIHVFVYSGLMLLNANFCNGSYMVGRDVRKITGVEPPKRWLVFMEAELRRCTNMVFCSINGDIIALLVCFSNPRKHKVRCYGHFAIHSNLFMTASEYIIHPNSIHIIIGNHREFTDPRCEQKKNQGTRINMYVHKLFAMNLTISQFTTIHRNQEHPLQGKCPGPIPSIKITYDGGSDVYCGQKYPWIIYSHSGMATVNLFLARLSVASLLSYIRAKISINMIDTDFVRTQPQSYASIVIAWGTYKIQMIRISVEFLYRIFISVKSDFDIPSNVIYDGPNDMLEYLSAYNNTQDGFNYISSTHQIYVMYALSTNSSLFSLNYTTHGYPAAPILSPNDLITLINNTGCGYNDPRAWMCTFKISASHHGHAVLHVTSFDITGPFGNLPTSAGIAVYNVINNTAILVHHLYKRTEGNLVITSTENQLFVAVYAYSVLANVSCRLATGASNCVGIFLQRHLKASTIQLTKHISYKINPLGKRKIGFVATFSVGDYCFFIQIHAVSIKPVARLQVKLVFVHNSALKITKRFEMCGMDCFTFKINGHYKPLREPNTAIEKRQSFVGPMKSIEFFGRQATMEFVMVSQVPCILPCHKISIVAANVHGIVKLCDICNFIFIDNIAWNKYEVIQDKTITFERILGDLSLNILIGSVEYDVVSFPKEFLKVLHYFAYYISYYVDGLVLQLEEKRVLMVDVTDNGLWKIPRGSMEIHQNTLFIQTIPTEQKVFRLGMYEYFVLGKSRLTGWRNETNQCHIRGGHLLTIFDQRELDFVVDNIIKPFNIEIAWIGLRRQVC